MHAVVDLPIKVVNIQIQLFVVILDRLDRELVVRRFLLFILFDVEQFLVLALFRVCESSLLQLLDVLDDVEALFNGFVLATNE